MKGSACCELAKLLKCLAACAEKLGDKVNHNAAVTAVLFSQQCKILVTSTMHKSKGHSIFMHKLFKENRLQYQMYFTRASWFMWKKQESHKSYSPCQNFLFSPPFFPPWSTSVLPFLSAMTTKWNIHISTYKKSSWPEHKLLQCILWASLSPSRKGGYKWSK